MPRYGTVDRAHGAQLVTCDPSTDGPIRLLEVWRGDERWL
jgi:hypothetical protein